MPVVIIPDITVKNEVQFIIPFLKCEAGVGVPAPNTSAALLVMIIYNAVFKEYNMR